MHVSSLEDSWTNVDKHVSDQRFGPLFFFPLVQSDREAGLEIGEAESQNCIILTIRPRLIFLCCTRRKKSLLAV